MSEPAADLLDDGELREHVQALLAASGADETEVVVSQHVEATTRFAAQGVTQNVEERALSISVRALVGRRSGRATTTSLERRDLEKTAARALAAARVAAEDPESLPLPDPQTYARLVRPAPDAGGDEDPAARADRVEQALARVRAAGLRPCGTYVLSDELSAVANSRGLFASHRERQASFALTAIGDDASGWAERIAASPSALDLDQVVAIAVDKAQRSRGPRDLEPGDHEVVLEPAAVTDLLLFLGHLAFSGLACNEGRSFLSGKLGERLFAERLDLDDDVTHPLTLGAPFDGEGMPRRALRLIDAGRAAAVVHDRRSAARAGTESTGHALPQPNASGPVPQNLVLAAGDSSLDDLVRATRRGVLVTRFHYTNVIDPKHLILTGMTRDGTFLIEDGRVTGPVRNLRFTDSVPRLLEGVDGVTRERLYQSAFFEGCYVVPGLRARALAFSSGTEF